MSKELNAEIKKVYALKKAELEKDASSLQNNIIDKINLNKNEINKMVISK